MSTAVFPLFYFGPANWFVELLKAERVLFESHDLFPRRTNRHRCLILGANGPIQLSIYLKKWHSGTTRTNEIELSYTEDWQKDHWNSIRSAYGRSAYFEHYEADFDQLFALKPATLQEWNMNVFELCTRLLGISVAAESTNQYAAQYPDATDLRRAFVSMPADLEKLRATPTAVGSYFQVFSDRFPFVPHLSILDLLFNEGPNAVFLLRQG